MASGLRLIRASAELAEAGKGVRFEVTRHGRQLSAFAIRYDGRVHGYLNQCGHVPTELDFDPGDFFDYSKLYLICSVHGALHDPASGHCVGGRCNGKGLTPIGLEELDGHVYLKEPNHA